jgi:16S rRNA A1518/A1519 N6-dimethyltransferase RsmA/KsgA/DIM1 with predicted DNA glycosylase/AP lyase activity
MIFWLVLVVLVIFAATALVGAPYVPTHAASIRVALDMLPLKKGDMVVDLGSGDGAFLKAAARRGFRVLGYEINPLLCVVAWLRCLPVHALVSIKLRNIWSTPLPNEVSAVFVFAASPYMNRLARYLENALKERKKPLIVVSYGFEIPGRKAKRTKAGLHYYELIAS